MLWSECGEEEKAKYEWRFGYGVERRIRFARTENHDINNHPVSLNSVNSVSVISSNTWCGCTELQFNNA